MLWRMPFCFLAVLAAAVCARGQMTVVNNSATTSVVAPIAGQNFSLPNQGKLPYPYDAMEPSIDARTMDLHWNRHTLGYLTGLNNALAKCPDLKGKSLTDLVSSVGVAGALNETCLTDVRNQGGGLYNHLLWFLHFLAPFRSQSWERDASPALKQAVQDSFGSFDAFKARFRQAALAVFGSGWAWLCKDKGSNHLLVISTPNQDSPLMKVATTECLPILGLDVWEHGYYLKYTNLRANYTDAFWDVVNWREVSSLYDQVLSGSPVDVYP